MNVIRTPKSCLMLGLAILLTLLRTVTGSVMMLAFGFNHAEAFCALNVAAEIDPTCAMCYLAIAYVLGPNINAAMEARMCRRPMKRFKQRSPTSTVELRLKTA